MSSIFMIIYLNCERSFFSILLIYALIFLLKPTNTIKHVQCSSTMPFCSPNSAGPEHLERQKICSFLNIAEFSKMVLVIYYLLLNSLSLGP